MSDQHPLDVKPKYVEIELSDGSILTVMLLSFHILRLIKTRVSERFPLINKADYEEVLENAMVATERYMPPEKEAAYKAALVQRELNINEATTATWLAAAVVLSADERAHVMERFREPLAQVRSVVTLPTDDDYEATLSYFVLANQRDYKRVGSYATRDLPISEGEIRASGVWFRDSLHGDVRVGTDSVERTTGEESASSTEG